MKRTLAHSAALFAATLLTTPATAADYAIDTSHASIQFRIQHLGYSWLSGRFDKFDGNFSFDEANPAASRVAVTIDTTSINTNHAERDKHLRSGDFLDVSKNPEASFVSKSVAVNGSGTGTITGDLTLNGVTREITLDVSHVGGGKDPWGGFRQGFTGTTILTLADFGYGFDLGPASQTVEMTLDIEGIRK